MDLKAAAIREKAIRALEQRHKDKHDSLISFIEYFFETELNKEFTSNWHYKVIAKELEELRDWIPKKLIINVPPRTWKTELITKCFPAWLLWQNSRHKFIVSGYSSSLTTTFSARTKDYYKSDTFRKIFPRKSKIRADQDTKELWELEEWGYYYATGAGGSITWYWADTFIIDDPIKPEDAESDIMRAKINNWFGNTVISRFDSMWKGNIIIIMQRLHWDDLCGYLLEEMKEGTGYDWKLLNFPAIAENNEEFEVNWKYYWRKEWEVLDKKRMPEEALNKIKETMWNVYFSTQYQQNPLDKESQEFHEEWFKYFENIAGGRVFTTCDPAFSKKNSADDSAIVTGMFIWEKMYVLEYTDWKYNPWELIDKMIYHIKKWNPEKIGIEAFAAQVTLGFSLKAELDKRWISCPVEDIRQTGDKESKIRRLIPLFRNWTIYHKLWMDKFEKQLKEFPRWKHDDVIDAVQMLYDMYTLQPNTPNKFITPVIKYDSSWRPFI